MKKHITEYCMVLSLKTYDPIANVEDFEMELDSFNIANAGIIEVDVVKMSKVDPVDTEVYKND